MALSLEQKLKALANLTNFSVSYSAQQKWSIHSTPYSLEFSGFASPDEVLDKAFSFIGRRIEQDRVDIEVKRSFLAQRAAVINEILNG